MISYQKKRYDSHDGVKGDSVLQGKTIGELTEDFSTLRDIRRKSFDRKFEVVFGLNQAKFSEDPTLREFAGHGL
jgi:hypothetical protein